MRVQRTCVRTVSRRYFTTKRSADAFSKKLKRHRQRRFARSDVVNGFRVRARDVYRKRGVSYWTMSRFYFITEKSTFGRHTVVRDRHISNTANKTMDSTPCACTRIYVSSSCRRVPRSFSYARPPTPRTRREKNFLSPAHVPARRTQNIIRPRARVAARPGDGGSVRDSIWFFIRALLLGRRTAADDVSTEVHFGDITSITRRETVTVSVHGQCVLHSLYAFYRKPAAAYSNNRT